MKVQKAQNKTYSSHTALVEIFQVFRTWEYHSGHV